VEQYLNNNDGQLPSTKTKVLVNELRMELTKGKHCVPCFVNFSSKENQPKKWRTSFANAYNPKVVI
jgi:hypothetical protein